MKKLYEMLVYVWKDDTKVYGGGGIRSVQR